MVATDQLCNEVNAAARQAADYWFLDGKSDGNADKCRRIEPEIVGLQSRLQQLIAAIQEQDEKLDLSNASETVMDLFDSMTGGQFKVASRDSDIIRAGRVYTVAAELTGQLRVAVAKRSRLLW